jgi:hypothetical protein
MSNNTTATTIAIPDNEPHTTVQTQYGMRFPDGTHQWETMQVGGGRYVTFGALAKAEPGTNGLYWNDYLEGRAQSAHVDPEAYAKSHQLVKRTVILVTTGAEDAHSEATGPVPAAVPWL